MSDFSQDRKYAEAGLDTPLPNALHVPHSPKAPSSFSTKTGGTGSYHSESGSLPQNAYGRLSRSFGFRQKYSLGLFVVMGGAMLGFCLSRFSMFTPADLEHKTNPGEWFWYRQKLYKPNIFVHIYLTTFAGILSGIQFVPALRKRSKKIIHRTNGYIVITILTIGMVTGAIVARHSFGGDVNTQAAFYTLAFLIVFSLFMGIGNVKNTPKHREWMLRSVFYLGSVITARFAKLSAIAIISKIGTFYSIWSCDEIAFVLGEGSTDYLSVYPECARVGARVAIRADSAGDLLNKGSTVRCTFGMALWVGLIIHTIGIELYIQHSKHTDAKWQGSSIISSS